jgi:hypothetical protein
LSLCHLSLARLRETEKALPPVLSPPDANPALPPQRPQRARQGRTIHGKARAQLFLIGFSSRSQCRKQAELRDFESCLAQLLVIDPRYDSSDASQVLTRAGQVKQCRCRLLFKRLCVHSTCIYILCFPRQARIALLHRSETQSTTMTSRGDPRRPRPRRTTRRKRSLALFLFFVSQPGRFPEQTPGFAESA